MASDAAAKGRQLALFFTALEALEDSTKKAAAAAAADGGSGARPPPEPPMWSGDSGAMKSALPGTIVKLQDGTWAMIPVLRAISVEGDPAVTLISVVTDAGGAATKRSESWAIGSIASACVGVLTVGGRKGPQAGAVQMAGLAAAIELVADPDDAAAKALTHARVEVTGMAANKAAPIDAVLTALKLKMEPWAGGTREALLHSGGGLPDAAAVAGAKLSTADLVG